ncbi:MAG: copper-binding protein [Acidobacteriota bacterium]|nr:MAG: copper-binding protein [Acidobacteriota bacterium]
MKVVTKLLATLMLSSLVAGFGCGGTETSNAPETPGTETREDGTQIYQVKGVVRGIDKNQKEIAIEHEEIPGFMSAMTMDFKVSDPAMLEDVAPGDKIDFELERKGTDLTVTKIIAQGKAAPSEGARIFKSNCAECHGENGGGTNKGISFLEGHALDHPREDFIEQVRKGEGDKMPSFSDKLTDAEIEAVVTYVRDVIQKDVKRDGAKSHDH